MSASKREVTGIDELDRKLLKLLQEEDALRSALSRLLAVEVLLG
jgi:hypothetical protein